MGFSVEGMAQQCGIALEKSTPSAKNFRAKFWEKIQDLRDEKTGAGMRKISWPLYG